MVIGGGDPKLCEPEPLTSKVTIAALWKKEQIDLAELARLRWVEKWKIERIASHAGIGTTSVKRSLRNPFGFYGAWTIASIGSQLISGGALSSNDWGLLTIPRNWVKKP